MVDSRQEANRQKLIEMFLAKQPRNSANVHEIAEATQMHWMTAEKELQRMTEEGRLHSEQIGSRTFYFLNGKGNWQDRVDLNKHTTLFIDTLIAPFGEKFVRVKQTKLIEGKWQSVGNIIITRDKLKEFVGKLGNITDQIETVQKQ